MDLENVRRTLGEMAYFAYRAHVDRTAPVWEKLDEESRERFERVAESFVSLSEYAGIFSGHTEAEQPEPVPEADAVYDPEMDFSDGLNMVDCFHELHEMGPVHVEVAALYDPDLVAGLLLVHMWPDDHVDEPPPERIRSALNRGGILLDSGGRLARFDAGPDIDREELIRDAIRMSDSIRMIVEATESMGTRSQASPGAN